MDAAPQAAINAAYTQGRADGWDAATPKGRPFVGAQCSACGEDFVAAAAPPALTQPVGDPKAISDELRTWITQPAPSSGEGAQ